MKRLTILMLLLVSTNAFAEWTRVTGSTSGEYSVYINYQSIRKMGHKVKFWTLLDFKSIQRIDKYQFMSLVNHHEYDCLEETERTLDFIWNSGNMMSGGTVYSDNNINKETKSITPETIQEILFNIVCSKK